MTRSVRNQVKGFGPLQEFDFSTTGYFSRGGQKVKGFPQFLCCLLAVAIPATGAAIARAQESAEPRLISFSPAVLTSSAECDAAPAAADACGELSEGPYFAPWTFSSDVMFLHRSRPSSQPLFRDDWLKLGNDQLNARELDFGFSTGWRIGAVRHGQEWDMELSYFQLDGSKVTAGVEGDTFLVTDSNGANLAVTDPELEYHSRLYSGEINFSRPRNEWLSLLVGLRYVELDDHYGAAGTGTFFPSPVSFYQQADNHLYGLQIGGNGAFLRRGAWTLEGSAKAGVYWNHADQNAVQLDTAPFGDRYSLSADKDHAAFLGELGLTGKYLISEHLAVRAGYQAMWLDGVALAVDQIAVNDFDTGGNHPHARVAAGNTVFYHGAFLGAEMTW